MKNVHLPIVAFLLSISSCKYSGQYQTINAANKFSVAVPSWMKEDKELKPGADFQYANHYRNFYAIGEAYPKQGFNKTADQLMTENLNVLRKSLKDAVVTDSVEINAGALNGTRVEIYGKMSNENIYFSEVLYEGSKNIYHLSIWTRSEDRRLHFKDDIERILISVREI